MATEVTPDTVQFVKDSLKKHGFEHALQHCSIDCVKAGMDADAFTYQVVALFATYILASSMQSHTDLEAKFETLQQNSRSMVLLVQQVTLQLAKSLDDQREAEAAVIEKIKANSAGPVTH